MEFVGHSLQTTGEVIIGITVIMVHQRVRKEHKIDPVVYKEMYREQVIGVLGIIFIVIGYLLQSYPILSLPR